MDQPKARDITIKKPTRSRMFLTLLKVGAFTIGGGYAMIPILQTEFVEKLRWMEAEEFMDTVALSQAVPGAMVINLAVYFGYTLFGYGGAALGLLGVALPSVLIMGLLALFFERLKARFDVLQRILSGVTPVVAGVIFAAAAKMMDGVGATWRNCLLALATIVAVGMLGVHPILCVAAGGAAGMLTMRGRGRDDA